MDRGFALPPLVPRPIRARNLEGMEYNDTYWSGRASLEGSLQALGEIAALQRARADLAEKRLRYLRQVCEYFKYDRTTPTWRILDILDGAADGEP